MAEQVLQSGAINLTPDGFINTVLRSGLLERKQVEEALRSAAPEQRNETVALANQLVKAGKLSRFQANMLLRGVSQGLVFGPFQVLAPIGRGGMGTVYLARDSRSKLLVALKVLPPKRAREEERLLARFRREMEMSRRVAHPHLAWTMEAGVNRGVYFIAMEFIPGRSLYRLVGDEGPLAVARAARLFAEAASGLDHAHQQGLIHRDLKPSNIMITLNDHAKVLDLGLALVQGEVPLDRLVVGGQGYIVGTMDYIAPEQTDDSSKVDARSDVYSLGCTLYFTLTGQPPFPAGSTLQKIQRHRNDEPPAIEQLNAAVPPPFARLVRQMMAKRPEQRMGSASQVREALLPWASQASVLPLDRAEDKGYLTAADTLQSQEAVGDLAEAVLLVEDSEKAHSHPGLLAFISSWLAQKPRLFLLLLVLAGLILTAGMISVGMVLHFLLR